MGDDLQILYFCSDEQRIYDDDKDIRVYIQFGAVCDCAEAICLQFTAKGFAEPSCPVVFISRYRSRIPNRRFRIRKSGSRAALHVGDTVLAVGANSTSDPVWETLSCNKYASTSMRKTTKQLHLLIAHEAAAAWGGVASEKDAQIPAACVTFNWI